MLLRAQKVFELRRADPALHPRAWWGMTIERKPPQTNGQRFAANFDVHQEFALEKIFVQIASSLIDICDEMRQRRIMESLELTAQKTARERLSKEVEQVNVLANGGRR